MDFSPTYVSGFAPEFPDSTHRRYFPLVSDNVSRRGVRPVAAPSPDGRFVTLQWLTEIFAPVSESTSGTSEGGHTGRDVSIGECVRQREPLVQNC